MASLPTPTVRAFLQGFSAVGLDVGRLLAAAGVTPAQVEVPEGRLEADVFPALWKEAFRQARREELPTEVGFAVPFGAFGAMDYLASTSATVGAAFHSLSQWLRHVGSGQLELVVEPGRVSVQLRNPEPFEGQQVSDEVTLALFVARFRAKLGVAGFTPKVVRLTRPAPRAPTRHAALYGCRVEHGRRVASLDLPRATWDAPLPGADPALQATLRQLATRLDPASKGKSDLVAALRARLRSALPLGEADAASAARALGVSERTLHRRLGAQGTTWRAVLEDFREAEAERLLASGLPLGELALHLGYSDQTAWNRAFRRWKGCSPTAWQARQR